MQTQEAVQESKVAAFNMRERTEPEFVQFAPGEVLEGVLVNVDAIEVGKEKKRTLRFTVRDLDDKKLRSFLGTYDISTKLTVKDIGHVVSVRYEGDDQNVRRNGNAMKRFKVLVSDNVYAPAKGNKLEDGTYITDADIPF